VLATLRPSSRRQTSAATEVEASVVHPPLLAQDSEEPEESGEATFV
jgi:hypothetical protein